MDQTYGQMLFYFEAFMEFLKNCSSLKLLISFVEGVSNVTFVSNSLSCQNSIAKLKSVGRR